MKKTSTQTLVQNSLALNLKYARLITKLTQEEMAEKANLHRTQIGAIERSNVGATIDTIVMLSAAIGVEPYVLLMPPIKAQQFINQVLLEPHKTKVF